MMMNFLKRHRLTILAVSLGVVLDIKFSIPCDLTCLAMLLGLLVWDVKEFLCRKATQTKDKGRQT